MPSELMDQRRMPSLRMPSVDFSDEIHMPPQRHVGFWKAESMPVHHGRDGLPLLFGNMSLASQPLEKSRSVNLNSAEIFPSLQDLHIEKQKEKLRHEHSAKAARTAELSVTSWEASKNDLGSRTNLFVQPASLNVTTNKFDLKGVSYENGFFASSLPHLQSKQFALLADDTLFVQPVNKVDSFMEEEPFDSLEAKEIEAQTIGNLLPDDEDLLSGVIDELERITPSNYFNDADEDLFSSGGGMELEADMKIDNEKHSNMLNGAFKTRNWGPNNLNGMEKSYGAQPSRTIFVRNVASNIEDTELKLLFQHYGDIHRIYTTCKSRGYIMVSYYDLRSACNAMASLQNKLLKNSKLNIHFSVTKDNLFDREFSQGLLSVFNLDPSISNEDVHQIFGAYGEIRQIREHQNCRLVEFYDVRAAEAALHALNMSDMDGKRIGIFPGLPDGSRQSIMQHLPCEIEKIEANGCRPQGSLFRDSPSRCSVSAGTVLSNGFGSGAKQALHAITQSSASGFMENGYDGYSYGSSPSPAGVATARSHHNQSGFGEHSHSLGDGNIVFDSTRNFHPHSLPERHESLTNGTSYNSPNTISAMSINLVRHTEGVDNMHVPRVSSGGLASLPFGCNDRAFGSLGNGNNTLQGHGNQYAWNNNSSYQQLQSPVMWHDSSFINNLPAQSPSQLQGLSRGHSHILNTSVSLSQLHVGSAPTLNRSLWDRRHMYTGDLSEAFPFHPDSVESMGFYGSSTLHQMELGSPNIFPHLRGNFVEPMISSPQIGLPSPQKFHMFHGRSSVDNMPASLDGPNNRVRSRRGESNSNQADNKKQYELDIDRIIRGEDNRTTLMIKNIPNKYTSKMLLAAIDENHRGTYDFIYLPIDFKNKCNVGYAFINMIEAQQIVLFYKSFNGKKWEKFNSEKVASLAYARIQGRSALIAHFQNSSLMNEDKRCRPILFHADGPNAGDQEPFPTGTNIRSRPGRSRAYNSEDNHQESPSNSTDGEDTSPVVDSFVPRKE